MNYYQMSYPRSGANWLRYIARILLNINKDYDKIDTDEDQYLKTHRLPPPEVSDTIDYSRGMILLLRDFKECITSHNTSLNERSLAIYSHPIECYHSWEQPKLLIYYEELVAYPLKVLFELVRFFQPPVDAMRAVHFYTRYDMHKKFSQKECKKIHPCFSEGRLGYHSQFLDARQWNDYVLEHMDSSLLPYIARYL